jgi:hypothetical protein
MATGSRAVLRLKAALQTVKFYKNPESGSEKKKPRPGVERGLPRDR